MVIIHLKLKLQKYQINMKRRLVFMYLWLEGCGPQCGACVAVWSPPDSLYIQTLCFKQHSEAPQLVCTNVWPETLQFSICFLSKTLLNSNSTTVGGARLNQDNADHNPTDEVTSFKSVTRQLHVYQRLKRGEVKHQRRCVHPGRWRPLLEYSDIYISCTRFLLCLFIFAAISAVDKRNCVRWSFGSHALQSSAPFLERLRCRLRDRDSDV